jgi:hypothetical protein
VGTIKDPYFTIGVLFFRDKPNCKAREKLEKAVQMAKKDKAKK